MAVQDEIRGRLDEADRLRRMQVENAQYEVDLARQRYMNVDPSRRLVADSLEASWNEKLRALESAREEYQRGRDADRAQIDGQQRQRILELAQDFPALWRDPATSHRERKRMTALLIEDVTLTRRDAVITLDIRFRGGRTQSIEVAAPIRECDRRRTPADTVTQIDALLDDGHTDSEIARILNERGLKTGAGAAFTPTSVDWVRNSARLRSVRQRLRAKGMLTTAEMARELGVCRDVVKKWQREGRLRGRRTHDTGYWLFWPLDQQPAAIAGRSSGRQKDGLGDPPAKGAV